MSDTNSPLEHQDASLLGHDNELPIQRWEREQDGTGRIHKRRGRICVWALFVTPVLMLSTIFLIFFLQRHLVTSAFGTPATKPTETTGYVGPARDLKILLHPEDHVSRDPGIRHFSWNITKATITPNGVQKAAFLINSTNKHPLPSIT